MVQDGEVARPVTEGLIWTFVGVSSLFVAARLYTRLRIVNKIGLDDYFTGAGLICAYVFAALVSAALHWGMGVHTALLSKYQIQQALMYSTASFAPGILSFTVPKLGVTALLIRILNPMPHTALALWIFVGTVVLLNLGCVVILFAQCEPVAALWNSDLRGKPGTRCWSSDVLTDYSIVTATLSAFADLFLAVYPATVLWKLQMNRKKKMALTAILGMGVVACAVSIYKATRLTGLDSGPDYTYTSSGVFLWTSIEGNTIIIAACFPTIAPLLESIFGRRMFYNASSAPSSSGPAFCQVCNSYTCPKSAASHHSKISRRKHKISTPGNSASVTVTRHDDHDDDDDGAGADEPGSSSRVANCIHHHVRKKNKSYDVGMGRLDVESQASILEYDREERGNQEEDGVDGEDSHSHHSHSHSHSRSRSHGTTSHESIPLDRIARRDEFSVSYATRPVSMSTSMSDVERRPRRPRRKRRRASSANVLVQAWKNVIDRGDS